MSNLSNLYVVVGAKTEEFQKKMTDMQKSLGNVSQRMGDFGKTMSMKVTAPMVAAGTALVAWAGKAGATADRLLDLSDITGMSTGAIQEYQHVARMAGVSTEAVTAAAEGLIRKLPQIEKEGGLVADAFQTLGVNLRDASGNMRSSDAIMDDMLYSLARMEDTASRNALGAQMFGGAWKDIAPILGMGEEGIKAAREEAERLNLVLSDDALQGANEFRKGMDRVKASLGGVFNEVGAKLAPVLSNDLLPVIEERLVPALRNLGERLAGLIERFANLDPKWQAVIAAGVGFIAVLGPLMLVLAPLIAMLPLVAAGLAALLSPIGLVVAAVVGLTLVWVRFGDDIKRVVTETVDRIKRVFTDFARTAYDLGADIIRGIWRGISSMGTWLVDQIRGFVQNRIIGPVKSLLGIASPSQVMHGFGVDIGVGLREGIEAEADNVENAMEDIVTRVKRQVEEAVAAAQSIAERIKTVTASIGGGGGDYGVPWSQVIETKPITIDLPGIGRIDAPGGPMVVPGVPISQIPGFASGGIVPGPIGAPQLALVHGGETILPTHRAGFGGEPTTIQIYLDGDRIADHTVKRLPKLLRLYTGRQP